MNDQISISEIDKAKDNLRSVIDQTELQWSRRLSEKYQADIYLKREDLHLVRSYKIRGAYYAISSLDESQSNKGVVCASAGNHAQGVAFSCDHLKVPGKIFMPKNTPKQKIERVRALGKHQVTLELVGDTVDDSFWEAKDYCHKNDMVFIHPFDNIKVITGQATIGSELKEQKSDGFDLVIAPVGGGGLISGVSFYLKNTFPAVTVLGVEPEGAPSMSKALEVGQPVTLEKIDKFVDGAAVKTVGGLAFDMVKQYVDGLTLIPEGRICETMIDLYQNEGIVLEPAGAMAVAGLEDHKDDLKGKSVVCLLSGGNNDITRYPEIMEKTLIYQGLKHYFVIEFSQRPGALRDYLDNALGERDDITLFEYVKKNNKETGPALVGIELVDKEDLKPLLDRMDSIGLNYKLLEKDSLLFQFFV